MHNRRNQVAVKPRPPSRKAAKPKPAPAFPSTIAIPPHRGSSPVAMALPQALLTTPQALFAMPQRESAAPKPPPKRRKSAAKRRKPPGKTRRAKAAAARPDPAAALAAFALPRREEPLVHSDSPPAPAAPTPGRALAKAQPEGLSAQIGQWLRLRLTRIWDRLGGVPHGSVPADQAELRRLRAENARLRDQLDALLTLQISASSSPRAADQPPVS